MMPKGEAIVRRISRARGHLGMTSVCCCPPQQYDGSRWRAGVGTGTFNSRPMNAGTVQPAPTHVLVLVVVVQ